MFDIKGKRTTVLGAARSGIAAVELVLKAGGIAKLSDTGAEKNVLSGVITEFKGHTKAFIQDSDYIVLSPGVSIYSEAVGWAREKNITVMGEVEFASRFCPCPIVAITGSNGKTTTTTLIARILERAGRRVFLCGNIGTPLSSGVLELQPTDIAVMEISSFQLESTIDFKPKVGVWLNFSQNHLDRHKDLVEYYEAKKRIFKNQDKDDIAVLNFTQHEFRNLAKELKAKVVFFDADDAPADITNPNYLAAMKAAEALGVSANVCREVFADFKGVEHRMELVRVLDGVDYINDSKSTTDKAGEWALELLSRPVIMICGGSDKNIDYTPLRSLVGRKVKRMIAIGVIKDKLRGAFADVVPFEEAANLQVAVDQARRQAAAGDCVLLSPMTASFDMFKDYEDRGRSFKEIVGKLS